LREEKKKEGQREYAKRNVEYIYSCKIGGTEKKYLVYKENAKRKG